jgi:hypothetical protein
LVIALEASLACRRFAAAFLTLCPKDLCAATGMSLALLGVYSHYKEHAASLVLSRSTWGIDEASRCTLRHATRHQRQTLSLKALP